MMNSYSLSPEEALFLNKNNFAMQTVNPFSGELIQNYPEYSSEQVKTPN